MLDVERIHLIRSPDLALILNTPKGRGVFAARNIPAGTIVDVCPVLVLGHEENDAHIKRTSMYHYTYNWPVINKQGKPKTGQAVVFGLGSMFNHSRDQNIGWMRDFERLIITYKAIREIKEGEELCISYGSRLTFEDADVKEVDSEGDGLQVLDNIQLEF